MTTKRSETKDSDTLRGPIHAKGQVLNQEAFLQMGVDDYVEEVRAIQRHLVRHPQTSPAAKGSGSLAGSISSVGH